MITDYYVTRVTATTDMLRLNTLRRIYFMFRENTVQIEENEA